jgi:hypothetical protein
MPLVRDEDKEHRMQTVKLPLSFLFLMVLSANTSANNDVLNGRMNVMECSHAEVSAYLQLPDPTTQVLNDYQAWERAKREEDIMRSENDPSVCIAMLYGDMTAIAKKVKDQTEALMAGGLPDISSLLSKAMDKLGESICGRAQAAVDQGKDSLTAGRERIREEARSEAISRLGEEAQERYINDALFSPEMKEAGLRYRNKTLDDSLFQSKIKSRWESELDELKSDAKDKLSGND